MVYYEDLTPYDYSRSEDPMLNVGWLSNEVGFPVGDTPE